MSNSKVIKENDDCERISTEDKYNRKTNSNSESSNKDKLKCKKNEEDFSSKGKRQLEVERKSYQDENQNLV